MNTDTNSQNSNNIFNGMDVIYTYTRQQAIDDGILYAVEGEQAKILRQFYKWPAALSIGVHNLIEETCANERYDANGIWHDIVWMSRVAGRSAGTTCYFKVIIGRKTHQLKVVAGPDDIGAPCLTFMLIDED